MNKEQREKYIELIKELDEGGDLSFAVDLFSRTYDGTSPRLLDMLLVQVAKYLRNNRNTNNNKNNENLVNSIYAVNVSPKLKEELENLENEE